MLLLVAMQLQTDRAGQQKLGFISEVNDESGSDQKNGSTAQGNSGEELFEVADVNSFHFHLG